MNDFDQSERIDALSAELAAAKSRIGELEQERERILQFSDLEKPYFLMRMERLWDALKAAKMHRAVWLHDEDCFSIDGSKPCVCGREELNAKIDAALEPGWLKTVMADCKAEAEVVPNLIAQLEAEKAHVIEVQGLRDALQAQLQAVQQERGVEGTNWFPESFVSQLQSQLAAVTHAFKNFHNNLCKRFDYGHDEIDWQRDQASLEEHIALQIQELTRQRNEQIVAARELAKAVTSMDKRLAAVTLDRDALSDELDSFKSENESFRAECVPLRNTVAELQGKLAAVTQERDTLKSDVAVFQGSTFASKRDLASKIAQLQAHNKAMRAALTMIRDHAYPENMQRSFAHAALTEEEKP